MYNGAIVVPLSADLDDGAIEESAVPEILELIRWLRPLAELLDLEVRPRAEQVSLIPRKPEDLEDLRRRVVEQLKGLVTDDRVQVSSHSVDILSPGASKANVLAQIVGLGGSEADEVLCLGDRGHRSGNDFELLSQPLALSVDKVSSRLDTCWNLSPPGATGVASTIAYLRCLLPESGSFRFNVAGLSRITRGR
jgi:hydroxymethylpyrimidine pyrophosphatase-like HAD family hydrolase